MKDEPFGMVYETLDVKVYFFGVFLFLLGSTNLFLILTNGYCQSLFYLFFYLIPSNTAISLFPHEPILIYFGKFHNLVIIALVATIGNFVAGYLDFQVFVPLLNWRSAIAYKKTRLYQLVMTHFIRFPFLTILVAAFFPGPFFFFKLLAFSVNYPLRKYLTALILGRFPHYYLLALIGFRYQISPAILIGIFACLISPYLIKIIPKLAERYLKQEQFQVLIDRLL
ncbi:MAG: hypothetical protein ONB05_01825 [candidate division KSB1 bacterium]|nr:hypothetical protein [candidate division KSB1 bacterium]